MGKNCVMIMLLDKCHLMLLIRNYMDNVILFHQSQLCLLQNGIDSSCGCCLRRLTTAFNMTVQVALSSKSFLAKGTLEFLQMHVVMVFQRCFLRELSIADVTDKVLVFGMNNRMDTQVRLGAELFPARLTRNLSLDVGLTADNMFRLVLFITGDRLELLSTLGAQVRLFQSLTGMFVGKVTSETLDSLKLDFTTFNRALDDLQSRFVVFQNMIGIVGFFIEFLAAISAFIAVL